MVRLMSESVCEIAEAVTDLFSRQTDDVIATAAGVRSLWFTMKREDESIASTDFIYAGMDAAEYILSDGSPVFYETSNRIASANLRWLLQEWMAFLGNPCWKKVKTYPPAPVLMCLVHSQFVQRMGLVANAQSLGDMQYELKELVRIIEPPMELFFASLMAEQIIPQPEAPRTDEPTAADIENGRIILKHMPTSTTVEAFRQEARNRGLKASNRKFGRIFEILTTGKTPSPPSPRDGTV